MKLPNVILRICPNVLLEAIASKWFLTLCDQAISSGGSFVTNMIICRTCAKEEFGLYILGLSIISFVMEIQNVLIWSPYTIFSPKLTGSLLSLYNGSSLMHQIITSTLIMLLLAIVGVFSLFGFWLDGLGRVIWTLVIVTSFITFIEFARRTCFASLHLKEVILLDSFVTIVQCSGILLLAFFQKLSTVRAFAVIGFACCLSSIIWLLISKTIFVISKKDIITDFGKNFSFGKWVLGGNMAGFLSSQLYPWFLTSFRGMAVTGVLGATLGVVSLANPFLIGAKNFLGPKTAHTFGEGGIVTLRRVVMKSTILIGAVIGLWVFILICFGDSIIVFIYGSKYSGNNLIISILAINMVVSAIAMSFTSGLWAMKRPDLNFKINLILVSITFIFGIWMTKIYGLLGVAIALLSGSLFVMAITIIIFNKISNKECKSDL